MTGKEVYEMYCKAHVDLSDGRSPPAFASWETLPVHLRSHWTAVASTLLVLEPIQFEQIRQQLLMLPRKLQTATAQQRSNTALIGSGTGIRWPNLDVDLEVAGLLETPCRGTR